MITDDTSLLIIYYFYHIIQVTSIMFYESASESIMRVYECSYEALWSVINSVPHSRARTHLELRGFHMTAGSRLKYSAADFTESGSVSDPIKINKTNYSTSINLKPFMWPESASPRSLNQTLLRGNAHRLWRRFSTWNMLSINECFWHV